jgi:cytochrome c biogenesis protein CcdA/DsbC/DsbD-like thiol-disulfide interchange protein
MSDSRHYLVSSVLVALASLTLAAQPGRIGIELEPLAEASGAHPGTTFRVAVQARLDPGFHVNSNEPLEPFLIATELNLDPPAGMELVELAWPQPIMLSQTGADEPLAVFEETFVIGASLAVDGGLEPGQYTVPGVLRYQACDETMCYLPATADLEFSISVIPTSQLVSLSHTELFASLSFDAVIADVPDTGSSQPDPLVPAGDENALTLLDSFAVAGTAGGYLNTDDFLEFIERAESGRRETGWFEGRGPLAIIALVLIGGMALNLTPCVLPLIPINLAIIGAGTRAGSRARGFALGSAYGLAMAVVYGVLGLGVILTAGTFGTINASPWFNVAIALLFVVLGLAMFDIFTIDFSRFQTAFSPGNSGHGSFVVAFAMGGVAALLAGACVAPVVIQVIVFSSSLYSTGTTVALALPFLLGLGMALPWPVAGAGLSVIPRPGPWMVRVKQAFGVFILGTAIYYGSLAYGLFSQRWVDPDEVANSVQAMLDEGWYASLDQGLQTALDEQKPVLVDVWATWCKNCLTMDRTTLKDPAVQTALDGYVKIKFQAEDPGASPANEVMTRFEGVGLPTYAILRPGDGSAASPAPR